MSLTANNRLILAVVGGILALCAVGSLLLFSGIMPEPIATVSPLACPFETPADTPVECGTMAMPLFHGNAGAVLSSGRGPSLFYTMVRARERSPEPDPVLVLGDDAGDAGSAIVVRRWPAWDGLNRNRDVFFVDLRGSGRSEPSFTCPEIDDVKARFGGLTAADAESCAAPLRKAGVDISALSSVESARDLIALRRALGIKTWNLVASGYGAVLARELVRLDADGVRSLVLDSPGAPKAGSTDLDRLAAVQRVFRQVFTDCKVQPACDKAYPRLDVVFDDLVQHLASKPLSVVFSSPATGKPLAAEFGTSDLLTLLTRLVGSGDEAAKVPALLWSVNDLVHGRAPLLADPIAALYAAYWRVAPPLAHGSAAVISCREVLPWSDIEGTRTLAAMFQPFVMPQALTLDYAAFCPVWKLPLPADDLEAPPLETRPTLILTGEYDTITPRYQAQAMVSAFHAKETMSFRGLGHGLLGVNACARTAVANFLDTPGRKLEVVCGGGKPPTFVTTPQLVAEFVPQPSKVSTTASPPVQTAAPPPVQTAALPPPVVTKPDATKPAVTKPAITKPATTKIECPFAIPGSTRVDCGTLEVPERRDVKGGKVVSLFYAITRASEANPLTDPVLVLNGGPGQPGSDLIESGWDRLAELRRSRDIIYVDQRGTGYSQPGLYCRNLSPVAFWHGGLTMADAEECLKPIRSAGYDIAAFNTVESVADLVELRKALGIRQWNLFGTSYGTVLAQELMRGDTAAVRSSVLNSPTTSRASWLDIGRMSGIRDVYRRLFADCAADAGCNAVYPKLEQAFLATARSMTERPLPVTYQDPRSGVAVSTRMSFANLLDIMTIMVGAGTTAERVPALLWHLHSVTEGREPARPELLAWLYMPYWKTMDMIAYGLNASIGCREIRAWIDPVSARLEAAAYQPFVMPQAMEQDYDVFCPAWKLPKGGDELNQPVSVATPTLLFSGDYDTLTPTALADSIASNLQSAQVLRFHAIGHDVFSSSACARSAMNRFISNPSEQVRLPCLNIPHVPNFTARKK